MALWNISNKPYLFYLCSPVFPNYRTWSIPLGFTPSRSPSSFLWFSHLQIVLIQLITTIVVVLQCKQHYFTAVFKNLGHKNERNETLNRIRNGWIIGTLISLAFLTTWIFVMLFFSVPVQVLSTQQSVSFGDSILSPFNTEFQGFIYTILCLDKLTFER